MARRLIWMAIAIALTIVAAYLSRFWIFRWWGREGLFGFEDLRPGGGLLARWLRGTDFAPFELLIWVLAVFAVLTLVQNIANRLGPKE